MSMRLRRNNLVFPLCLEKEYSPISRRGQNVYLSSDLALLLFFISFIHTVCPLLISSTSRGSFTTELLMTFKYASIILSFLLNS